MRVSMALLAIVAATVQASAATEADCSGGDPVVVSGSIDEVVTTDATSAEIILDRSAGACGVDAIRTEVVPGTCVEGRRVTGEGIVHMSQDGTWTWLEANDVRCD